MIKKLKKKKKSFHSPWTNLPWVKLLVLFPRNLLTLKGHLCNQAILFVEKVMLDWAGSSVNEP